MDKATAAFTDRAAALAEPSLVKRRHDFGVHLASLAFKASKGGDFGGSGHDRQERMECSAELSVRAAIIVKCLTDAHTAMQASAGGETEAACRKWTAQRILEEADALAGMMRKPRTAFGEDFPPRQLTDEAVREIDAANATIGLYFDSIRAQWAKRAARIGARIVLWIRKLTGV